ncbi:radical SAM protein, partial [Candidatus Omnitrophota bacterium]
QTLKYLLSCASWLKNYLTGKETVYPLIVEFHPGPACPLNCVFCHNLGCKRYERDKAMGRKLLSAYRIRKTISELAQGGTKEIWVSGGLEPLSAKENTITLLKEAKKHGLTTRLYTDAALMDRKIMEAIVRYCDWVRVSLNATDEQMYQEVVSPSNRKYTFTRATRNISKLVALRNETTGSTTHIGISHVLVPEPANYKELEKAAVLAYELGVDLYTARSEMVGKVRRFKGGEINHILRQIGRIEEKAKEGRYGTTQISFRGLTQEELKGRDHENGERFLTGVKRAEVCIIFGYKPYR